MPHAATPIDHRPLMQSMAGEIWRTITGRLKQAADPFKSLLFLLRHQRLIGKQHAILMSIAATRKMTKRWVLRGFCRPLDGRAVARMPLLEKCERVGVVLEKEIGNRMWQATVASLSGRTSVYHRPIEMCSCQGTPFGDGKRHHIEARGHHGPIIHEGPAREKSAFDRRHQAAPPGLPPRFSSSDGSNAAMPCDKSPPAPT